MLLPALVIIALILLNGLFVAAEFAILGAPRAGIERRAAEGDPAARTVQDILHDPRRQDRYIATAQLGITLASLGLGMYGEHALAEWLALRLEGAGLLSGLSGWVAAHSLASALAVGALTYLHIVVGEMVPKSIALMHAERTVLRVTRPMLWLKVAAFPLVVALNGLGNGILRLLGVERQLSASHYLTTDELQFIVQESQEGGQLRAESGRVLRELFEFAELSAREVMVPRVHVRGLPLGAAPEELAELIGTDTHTRYPVFEGSLDRIAGVVHIKDLLRLLSEGRPLTPEEVREAAFLPETAELDRVIEAMRQARTQLVVVMDEHGGTTGIITIEDLCDEIVGQIEEDEDDVPEILLAPDGRLHVAGTVRVEEVGERLGLALEHEEVDTVSGLVLALLGRPPKPGDAVLWEGLRFEVEAVEGHGVERCIVTAEGRATNGE